ncbi:Na/Pi cotransporter family protein [Marinicella sediminis]|uniref:Na/Pi cotransporter family protein n=1 Tax=Marinicella sediminis TaxID=1792834 RepID=A0ABV7JDL9_9GAMM|nr:Na/Pi symporter [Marinicella sediminis]
MAFWQALAGLGLFLFGMKQLELALKKVAGPGFNHWIIHSTNHPLRAVFTGIVATAMVQSSSLVGLITLAFLGAGIMPLVNGIGVVLGSNLGTTFTGWMVATLGFKVDMSLWVMPLLGVSGLGCGLLKGRLQSISLLLLGLGLLLLGLDWMKGSFTQFSAELQLDVLQGYPLVVYLLFGVVITAIIQSSSVMMMLALAALYADMLSLPAAAALVIGADLGTTSTVLIGSLQGAAAKRRLAMAHVIFNLVVDVLAFLSIGLILSLISWLHIDDPLFGLVAFHSIFNLTGLLLFLPFIRQYSAFLERLVQDREPARTVAYIHAVPATVSEAAMLALNQETKRLIALVVVFNMRVLNFRQTMISDDELPEAFSHQSDATFYQHLKSLEGDIIHYALQIQKHNPHLESQTVPGVISMAHSIDHHMQAIRAAIYAAKSIKDIRDNIEQFQLPNQPRVADYFAGLMNQAARDYEQLVELVMQQEEILAEDLQQLKMQANTARREFRQHIHQHMSDDSVSGHELSTLLNVNKELYNSKSALVKALGNVRKTRSVQ